MTEGHCNCEGIKVSIPAMPGNSILCYCSNCRRGGSSAFSVIYLFDKSDVDIKDPNGYLKTYTDSKTKSGNTIYRQFCSNCGCPVASVLDPNSPKIVLKGGLFDHIPQPVHEAFDQERPTWLNIIKPGGEEKKL